MTPDNEIVRVLPTHDRARGAARRGAEKHYALQIKKQPLSRMQRWQRAAKRAGVGFSQWVEEALDRASREGGSDE